MQWFAAIVGRRLADAGGRHERQSAREMGVKEFDVPFQTPVANSREQTFGDPDALAQAIQELPPGQRQAVELLKLRELSLKEASALTGMSIGALKIATHRAIASLRRALQGTDEE